MEMPSNHALWARINAVLVGENMGEALVTMIDGMVSIFISIGVAPDDPHARAHLAAIMLSPLGAPPGSLQPLLNAELARIARDHDTRARG
jgi:hypothetical protein